MDGIHNQQNKSKTWLIITLVVVAVVILAAVTWFAVSSLKKDRSDDRDDSAKTAQSESETSQPQHPMKTKEPLDDKTFFMKDYVSLNAKDTCTWRWGGDCMDSYGSGSLKMQFITSDGTTVQEANISNYRVTAQNVEPDTQLDIGEYGTMNIEQIALTVETIDPKKTLKTVEKTENMSRASCTDKAGTEVSVVATDTTGLGSRYDTVSCKYTMQELQ
jgi:cytoskeletal protein RodZ